LVIIFGWLFSYFVYIGIVDLVNNFTGNPLSMSGVKSYHMITQILVRTRFP